MHLNENLDFEKISYGLQQGSIVVVDNFFKEEAASFLRNRMLNSKTFQDYYNGYQAIDYHYSKDQFTTELADEIIKKISILDKFQRAWSFIYENKCKGVYFHADPSSINLNVWVSKNSSVEDFNENGLTITKLKPPKDWTRDQWNRNKDDCISHYLLEKNPEFQIIKYNYNRAIFFDGAYFHRSANVNMKEGHENKRVSYTMLFGRTLE